MSRLIRALLVGLLSVTSLSSCFADVSATVNVSGTQHDTDVVFSGYASPDAFITVLDGASVVGTVSADAAGVFSKTLTNQTAGSHSFGLSAIDGAGVSTSQINVLLSLQPNAETTVSDILMPPTITELAGPRPGMHGSATPNTEITLFVSPDGFTESATTDAGGAWSHTFSTPLPAGSRSAYAVASTQGGLVSSASSTVTFNVTCAVADYDCSGRVDIVDFSVLMYYWGTNDPTADTNGDGIIDLTDFSIMMYYWNG